MKKFASLGIVLILVLCLATTAFAAEPQVFDVYGPMDMPTSITLAAGEEATINVQAFQLNGKTLRVTGDNAVISVTNMMGTTTIGPDSVVEGVMQNIMGCTVVVKNAGTAAATYALEVVIPVGEMGNPAALVMGENNATLEENAQGYFYTWTAPTAGKLTVTMLGNAWTYTVNNITAGSYGDTRWSDDDPVVNPTVIDVAKGDEIQVIVCTYDPNSWAAPAGEVSFGAIFDCKEHAATKVDAVAAGCHNNGNIEHWYCADCNGYWTNAELTGVTNARSVITPATGAVKVEKIDAVEATCHANGNIEHYVCGGCEGLFADEACTQEIMPATRVIIPATGMTANPTHVAATTPICHRNGMQEHWICATCGGYFTDAACTQQVMQPKQLYIPAEVTMEYHEKVAATCTKNGMEEYWYCKGCDCYFTDAEGIFNIASKRLTILATGHNMVNGECTICNDNPKTGDAGILAPAFAVLVSAMSTVALVVKKKEF